jgi:hypothetical protein
MRLLVANAHWSGKNALGKKAHGKTAERRAFFSDPVGNVAASRL